MKTVLKSLLFTLALVAVAYAATAILTSSPSRAQAGALTVELARSPAENSLNHGKWLATGRDCYNGCIGWCEDEYIPYPAGPWLQPGFDDSGWSSLTHVYWSQIWDDDGWSPIPDIGKHVAHARSPDMDDGHTDLHRRWFYVPDYTGYRLDHVHLHLFSDNHSEWYINGQHFHHTAANFAHEVDIWDVSGFVAGADNLLAVSVANNNVCSPHCNPHGIQYLIEAVYVQVPTPTPTATPYVQAYARNPQGQAVNVASMGRSRFDVGGPAYALSYADRSSYTGAALDYAGRDDRGAFFRSYGDQVLMGVTPSPNGVAWQSGTTDLYYGWPNWYTGGRSIVAVYATATPTPTPTPWLDAHVRNPQGTPVAQTVCRARFNSSGSPSYNTCQTTADYQSVPMSYGSYTYRGLRIAPSGNNVVVGVTPAPVSGARRDVSGATLYGWSGWNTGERDVTFVVATPTPTPTPVPQIVVHAVNPQGTPVAVSRVGSVRFDEDGGAWLWAYDTNASDYSGSAPPYGSYDNRGAYFRHYSNQVFLGVTATPGVTQVNPATRNIYFGWPDWYAGDRVVYGVFATPTPTPTPTNTPTITPSPTPTNTPTNTPTPTPTPPPYVLPPTVRPFLHLRGHEPPYTTQQIDYLATDDSLPRAERRVHHYAQVYLHAVPAAEVVSPPQYCEWNGSGWTCTLADAFEWLDYSFQGVRRAGYWFPSPVGEVTKAYSTAEHTFDPYPRWIDPDYGWPREFLHLYFNLPAGSTPPCPVSGLDGPCIVYENRAPGEEVLVTALRGRATWTSPPWSEEFELAVEYPLILSATQWEAP